MFFINDTATTEIYTLSLHDALPISTVGRACWLQSRRPTRSTRGGSPLFAAPADRRGSGPDRLFGHVTNFEGSWMGALRCVIEVADGEERLKERSDVRRGVRVGVGDPAFHAAEPILGPAARPVLESDLLDIVQ